MRPKLVAVVGTTASGKSTLGIELARIFGGEVVSADSRQVYRGLDLGTGKVTPEETLGVPHHLLDILPVNRPFSLAEYQTLAYEAIDKILFEGKVPFLVGGTGLYARAVTAGYVLQDAPPQPELREELSRKSRDELLSLLREKGVSADDPQISVRRMIRMIEKINAGFSAENRSTPRYNVLQIGVTYPREELYRRIGARLDARIEAGMIEEVRRLLDEGATPAFLLGLGLEYRCTYRYLAGEYPSFAAYREDLYKQICRFAKRQQTWFRRDDDVHWLDVSGDVTKQARELVARFLTDERQKDDV